MLSFLLWYFFLLLLFEFFGEYEGFGNVSTSWLFVAGLEVDAVHKMQSFVAERFQFFVRSFWRPHFSRDQFFYFFLRCFTPFQPTGGQVPTCDRCVDWGTLATGMSNWLEPQPLGIHFSTRWCKLWKPKSINVCFIRVTWWCADMCMVCKGNWMREQVILGCSINRRVSRDLPWKLCALHLALNIH